MSPRLQALKYILEKTEYSVNGLTHYMDKTKYVISDHERAQNLIKLAREIVEEMMTP
jgi:hypothetical protein